MKSMSDYSKDAVSAALEKAGAFFAFSEKQFEENKVDGVKYGSRGAGLICPIANAKQLNADLKQARIDAVAKDKEENTAEAIIERELSNYECYYTYDIDDAISSLSDYGYSNDKILEVFHATKGRHDD
tara:strand:+ start:1056 stop:1439 length:384 start_codon:yes stop_codon:yes gene_type:complete